MFALLHRLPEILLHRARRLGVLGLKLDELFEPIARTGDGGVTARGARGHARESRARARCDALTELEGDRTRPDETRRDDDRRGDASASLHHRRANATGWARLGYALGYRASRIDARARRIQINHSIDRAWMSHASLRRRQHARVRVARVREPDDELFAHGELVSADVSRAVDRAKPRTVGVEVGKFERVAREVVELEREVDDDVLLARDDARRRALRGRRGRRAVVARVAGLARWRGHDASTTAERLFDDDDDDDDDDSADDSSSRAFRDATRTSTTAPRAMASWSPSAPRAALVVVDRADGSGRQCARHFTISLAMRVAMRAVVVVALLAATAMNVAFADQPSLARVATRDVVDDLVWLRHRDYPSSRVFMFTRARELLHSVDGGKTFTSLTSELRGRRRSPRRRRSSTARRMNPGRFRGGGRRVARLVRRTVLGFQGSRRHVDATVR